MSGDQSTWLPPLIAVLVGLLAGLVAVWRFRARDAEVTALGLEEDLRREHEAALEALKTLELDQGKLTDRDYQEERSVLIRRGASALRALDEHRTTAEGARRAEVAASDVPGAPARDGRDDRGGIPRELRGSLATLGVLAVVWLLVRGAEDNARPRGEGPMTGGSQVADDPNAEGIAELARIEAEIAAHPDDIALVNRATRVAILVQALEKAMKYNQRAFELDASNVDAIANKAIMAAMVGLVDRALEGFDRVLAVAPDHGDALAYKGLVLLQAGRAAEAVPALERAVAVMPGNPSLTSALMQARLQAEGGPGGPTAAGAPPGGTAPPVPGGMPSPHPGATPPAPGEVVLAGTASLAADAAARIPPGAVLYISVRDPGGGPPLAAKKLPPGPFPVTFQITTSDAISMGGAPRPFPPAMNLVVRIDNDGNPMSKDPSEPQATVEGVARGATGLALHLE